MPASPGKPSKRVLEPLERISEVLFGLIMALTITGAVSAAQAGKAEVHTMLVTALGCNLAWGIIDAGMYLMARLGERGNGIITLRTLRGTVASGDSQQIVADAVPPLIASVMTPQQLEEIRQSLVVLPDLPVRPWLTGRDWLGAFAMLLLVFSSTFPMVIPFIFVDEPLRAMRLSNAVGVLMLFLVGYAFGQHAGLGGWSMGGVMVAVGTGLVAMTIALGG